MDFQEYPKYVYPNDEVDAATGVLVQGADEEAAARKRFAAEAKKAAKAKAEVDAAMGEGV